MNQVGWYQRTPQRVRAVRWPVFEGQLTELGVAWRMVAVTDVQGRTVATQFEVYDWDRFEWAAVRDGDWLVIEDRAGGASVARPVDDVTFRANYTFSGTFLRSPRQRSQTLPRSQPRSTGGV